VRVEDAARAGTARAPSAAPPGYARPTRPAPSRSAPRVGRPSGLLAQVVDERAQLRPRHSGQAVSRQTQRALAIMTGRRRGERSGARTRECLLQERVGASGGGRGGERRGDRCDSGDGRVAVVPGCPLLASPKAHLPSTATSVAVLDRVPVLTRTNCSSGMRTTPPFAGLVASDFHPRRVFQSRSVVRRRAGRRGSLAPASDARQRRLRRQRRRPERLRLSPDPRGCDVRRGLQTAERHSASREVGNIDAQVRPCAALGVTAYVGLPASTTKTPSSNWVTSSPATDDVNRIPDEGDEGNNSRTYTSSISPT